MRFLPGARLRHSTFGHQLPADSFVGGFDNGVGESAELAGDFRQRAQTEYVANQDAQQLAAAESGELEWRRQARRQRGFEHLAHLLRGEYQLQIAGFEEPIGPLGVAQDLFRKEMTVAEHRDQVTQARGRAGQALEPTGVPLVQAREVLQALFGRGRRAQQQIQAVGGGGRQLAREFSHFTAGARAVVVDELSEALHLWGENDFVAGADCAGLDHGRVETAEAPLGRGRVSVSGECVENGGLNSGAVDVEGLAGGAALGDFDYGFGADLPALAGTEVAAVDAAVWLDSRLESRR